jgi:hypothetical protein
MVPRYLMGEKNNRRFDIAVSLLRDCVEERNEFLKSIAADDVTWVC